MFSAEGVSSQARLWQLASGDRSRQVATCVAAAAQVLLPTLVGPRFDAYEQPPQVIQPAPYTFAVWLPIFATSAACAGLQARSGARENDVMRRVGWPLAGAFAATGVWAPLVRTGRYWSAQTALAAIAGFTEVARQRLAAAPVTDTDPALRTAGTLTAGMLSAWGLTATGVNLAAMLAGEGVIRDRQRQLDVGSALLLALGAAGSVATTATRRSAPALSSVYGGTLLWGLTGVVVGNRHRSRRVVAAAGAAMVPVMAAVAAAQAARVGAGPGSAAG